MPVFDKKFVVKTLVEKVKELPDDLQADFFCGWKRKFLQRKRYEYINNMDFGEHRIRKQSRSKRKQNKAKQKQKKANKSKRKQKKAKLSKEKLRYNLLIRVLCNNPVTF